MNRQIISNSNYVLRRIFEIEENIDIIQDFIEKILEVKIFKITQNKSLKEKIKYFNPKEITGINEMQIITEDKKVINVGIQIIDGQYIQEKMLIYGALIHGIENIDNSSSNRTITINIVDLEYFSTYDYHKKINFSEGDMVFHVIELPKFKKSEIETEKEAWIAYLKAESKELVEKSKIKSEKVNKLDKILTDYWREETL